MPVARRAGAGGRAPVAAAVPAAPAPALRGGRGCAEAPAPEVPAAAPPVARPPLRASTPGFRPAQIISKPPAQGMRPGSAPAVRVRVAVRARPGPSRARRGPGCPRRVRARARRAPVCRPVRDRGRVLAPEPATARVAPGGQGAHSAGRPSRGSADAAAHRHPGGGHQPADGAVPAGDAIVHRAQEHPGRAGPEGHRRGPRVQGGARPPRPWPRVRRRHQEEGRHPAREEARHRA